MVPKKPRRAHNRTHGESHKTVENKCWKHIKEVSKTRGIPFDAEWDKYENFLRDMGRRPSDKHKLRRLDKSKGFNKENCKWMTKSDHSKHYDDKNKARGKEWEWQWEYRSWVTMTARCSDPENHNYYIYGAVGITVCERWQGEEGFSNFCQDMGKRPSIKHTLHRKKNNLGYSPENCIWLCHRGQQIHKTTSKFIEYKGYNFNISTWADITGLPRYTISNRLKDNWLPERILTTPHKGIKQIIIPRSPEEYLKQHNDRITELYPEMKEV